MAANAARDDNVAPSITTTAPAPAPAAASGWGALWSSVTASTALQSLEAAPVAEAAEQPTTEDEGAPPSAPAESLPFAGLSSALAGTVASSQQWAAALARELEGTAVVQNGLSLGGTLVASSLGALEAVGRTALDVVGEQRARALVMGTEVGVDRSLDDSSSSSSITPVNTMPPVVTQPGALPAARVPQRPGVPRTFAAAFHDQGQPHLHALEALATTARSRMGAGRTDAPAMPARLRAAVSLDAVENELDDSKTLVLVSDTGLAAARGHVEAVVPGPPGMAVLETVTALAHAAVAPPPEVDGTDTRTRLMQRHADVLEMLATWTAALCQLVLRAAEAEATRAATGDGLGSATDVMARAERLRAVVVVLLKDANSAAALAADALQAGAGADVALVRHADALVNGLYVDVGDAVALVQEAQRAYAVVARWAHAAAVAHAAAAAGAAASN